MAAEDHEYRGYRIVIRRHGSGWRTTIYAPASQQPILGPQSDDPASRDELLEKAKGLIDSLLGS
jgi:hypothetical protein